MAFADAVFDGRASLEGVDARLARDLPGVRALFDSRQVIPVYVRPLGPLLEDIEPAVLVDARMRKHSGPERQRGLADSPSGWGRASLLDATPT